MAKEPKWKVWSDQRSSRNQNWTESETATLLNVWLKYLDILKLHRRTGKIYDKMAGEFAQCGYNRSSVELQKKVSNLTQEYRKEKVKVTNGLGPSKWKFFHLVEDIVTQLAVKKEYQSSNSVEASSQSQSPLRSTKTSESDADNTNDIQFMAVYLNEQSMSEEEDLKPNPEPQSQMPVIVSVESQHPSQRSLVFHQAPNPPGNKKVLQELQTDMHHKVLEASRQPVHRTLVLRPSVQESGNNKVLKDLKTDMHRVLEESMDIHRQQIALQQRQVQLQEDMLKIMAKFIDNCP